MLLATKLFIPSNDRPLVARTHLLAKLDAALHSRVILVAAPAGFGKTTLISAWSTRHRVQNSALVSAPPLAIDGPHFCWLALDENDNDPIRFLSYLVAALQTADANLGTGLQSMLQTSPTPSLETALTALLNEIEASATVRVLVLDDYHLITAQPIHDALTFLIEHLPASLHLVIMTRVDPPLPLARWRVRNQLAEIRASDLRFTPDEAATFLNRVMGLTLSTQEIATLEARTEGWIAALQLAALSMQGRNDLAGFITAFTGSHRFIIDYLSEEVLHHQPESVRKFLIATSILERICGPLGDALTQSTTGQATLEYLEQSNLFLIPLDDERHWYRYHHLFRDLLHQRLREASDAATMNELHRRAADWYAQKELTDEAIQHYLAAGALGQAADLIEAIGYQEIGKGYLARLGVWLEKLPTELIRARPRLVLWWAWVLNLTGQPGRLEQWLQEAEFNLQTVPPDIARDMQAQIITLHAYKARRQGDFIVAIAQLQQALADCAPDNLLTRTAINLNLGFNYWMTGQLTLADEALEATQREARLIHATHMVLLARGTQANVAIAQGKLRRARQLCEEAIQDGLAHNRGQPYPSAGYAYALLGHILYEKNELVAAESALQLALDLGELMADGTVIRRAIFCLASLRQMQGDVDAAQPLWQRAFAADDTVEEPLVALQQVRAWLVQATIGADETALVNATQWASQYRHQIPDTHSYISAFAQTLLAWVDLLQGQPAQALAQLSPLIEAATAAGHTAHHMQMLVIQALAQSDIGDSKAAQTTLYQLLGLTAPEGYVRVFVDAGEAMCRLLVDLRTQSVRGNSTGNDTGHGTGNFAHYIDQLLPAFATPSGHPNNDSSALQQESLPRRTIPHLIEPLSERELEILRLVADGLSNSAIAETIIVTVGTVKKHLNNIYGKLGVASRTQAIARGHELDLF